MMVDLPSGAEAMRKLINPIALEEFLHRYWQREVLVVRRDTPGYFDELLTLRDIDELLSSVPIPTARVNLGRDAVGIPATAYTAYGDQGDGMYIRPADVLRLHRQGNTIILRTMHLFMPPLGRLCAAAEAFFHCKAQANIYITPAGTQSSYPHWDAHDIFVIQVAGSKRWRLHAAPISQPLYTYQFNRDRHDIGPQIDEFTLQAGDVAYLPRGVAHDPLATDYSVHIALGVLVSTWADVFASMFESIALSDPACRGILPVRHGQHAFDMERCGMEFSAVAAKFLDVANMRAAISRMSEEFMRTRRPDTRNFLTQFALGSTVTASSIVELPPDTLAVIEPRGDSYHVMFNGVELRIDVGLGPALEFIQRKRRVSVCEIPAASDAHRIALAQKLVDEGALRLCVEETH